MGDMSHVAWVVSDRPHPARERPRQQACAVGVEPALPIAGGRTVPAIGPRPRAPDPRPYNQEPIEEEVGEDSSHHQPRGFRGAWTPLEIFKETVLRDTPFARRVPEAVLNEFVIQMWIRMSDAEQGRYWEAHFRIRRHIVRESRRVSLETEGCFVP